MPKQAAKLLFLSPFPLGEGPGMGPYVLIGGFCVYPLNSYTHSITHSTPLQGTVPNERCYKWANNIE